MCETALDELAGGAAVEFGLSYYNLVVSGTFIGENAKWDGSRQSLAIRSIPVAKVRERIEKTKVNVRGVSASGTCINTITDVTTGEINTLLTPGGGSEPVGKQDTSGR
jgi:hypothetical protein